MFQHIIICLNNYFPYLQKNTFKLLWEYIWYYVNVFPESKEHLLKIHSDFEKLCDFFLKIQTQVGTQFHQLVEYPILSNLLNKTHCRTSK